MRVGLAAATAAVAAAAVPPTLDDVFGYLDTQPAATLLTGFGDNGELAISTTDPEAQAFFSLGVDMLHDFNPYQALVSFYAAHLADEDAMMPMWGVHKALQWNGGYADACDEALARADALAAQASAHERMYLDLEHDAPGVETFNASMAAIVDAYPTDVTARLFWAWGLVDQTVDVFGRQQDPEYRAFAQDMLHDLVAELPDSPAAVHYLIHAYEDTYSPQEAAGPMADMTELAPRAGHLSHMPGHIWFLLGDYDQGHAVFKASIDVDSEFMADTGCPTLNHWEYYHNLAYDASLLAEAGRVHEASQLSLRFQAMRPELEAPAAQPLEFSPQASRALARYFLQILPQQAFLHWRTEAWDACAEATAMLNLNLELRLADTPSAFMTDFYAAIGTYCSGMGAAFRGAADEAAAEAGALVDAIAAVNASFSGGGTYDYSVMDRALVALAVNQAELDAMAAVAAGDADAGLAQLSAAAALEAEIPYNEPTAFPRPVLQSVAAVQLRLAARAGSAAERDARLDAVIDACERILSQPLHSGSGYAMFRAGLAAERKGDADAATAYYARMLDGSWASADADLPQVRHARAYLGRS